MPSPRMLFGYGSLINTASRAVTGTTGRAWPVRLNGFSRGWNARSPTRGTTPVGIQPASDAVCNGVLVEMDDSQFPAFDDREIHATLGAYERTALPCSAFTPLGAQPPQADVWIYQITAIQLPETAFPIPQTYVDVIIEGCLEYGRDFAEEFIRTTTGWDSFWIDDRAKPFYERARVPACGYDIIDRLLADELGDLSLLRTART